jgi:hypothetical protein
MNDDKIERRVELLEPAPVRTWSRSSGRCLLAHSRTNIPSGIFLGPDPAVQRRWR